MSLDRFAKDRILTLTPLHPRYEEVKRLYELEDCFLDVAKTLKYLHDKVQDFLRVYPPYIYTETANLVQLAKDLIKEIRFRRTDKSVMVWGR